MREHRPHRQRPAVMEPAVQKRVLGVDIGTDASQVLLVVAANCPQSEERDTQPDECQPETGEQAAQRATKPAESCRDAVLYHY